MTTLKTSSNAPLRVDFVESGRLEIPGRIGLTIAPGKKDRPRQWDRDLDADLDRLREHYKADVLVSLIESHEYKLLQITELHPRSRAIGMDVRSFPIVDVSTPKPERMSDFMALVDGLVEAARAGKTIVIHCRGGLGRSGIVAACCLVRLGLGVARAIAVTREARPGAIETPEQERWVATFAQNIRTEPSWSPELPRTQPINGAPSLSAFRGCLLGGAIGDALGYPVEFWKTDKIVAQRGTTTPLQLAATNTLALISDDTQMTLFTAEGLIRAWNRGSTKGICHPPSVIGYALLRWLETQGEHDAPSAIARGWLVDERRLHSARAPGATCLSALLTLAEHDEKNFATTQQPPNNSKGCGAVMRVAPCGLGAPSREDAFELGRDSGVITHGHPSGYLSAAYFSSLIWDLSRGSELPTAMDHANQLLVRERGHEELHQILDRVRTKAARGTPTAGQIEALGGGWTGEEALAIALLCTLTLDTSESHPIESALWRAAAHSGDSDSTAAITGNLLGAMYGLSALPASWLDQLELRDVIDRVACDLYSRMIQHEYLPEYPPV